MSQEEENAGKLKDDEEKTETVQFKDVDTFIKNGFKAFVEATRHANSLPKDRDYDFFSTHEGFKKFTNSEADRIMDMVNMMLRKNDIDGNIKHRPMDERVEMIIEANDVILERVATTIDELEGLKKLPEVPVVTTVTASLPVSGSWNKKRAENKSDGVKGAGAIHLLAAKNIVCPQKFFKDKINNSNDRPWEPRLKDKPNSLKPLAIFLEESDRGEEFTHPYECELDKFTPPEAFLKERIPVEPKDIKKTPLHEINTPEQLDKMLEELRKFTEIAVDLEHHSYRTFMGITCLMQISTTEADYLIDTLSLRDRLHILNEIFTKNSVVKIFHGADSDIQWLQRDLSLYVVNMFDTHKAAKQLGYSGLSLSYLLNRFCCFVPNKQFQLADWRIRPLPEELKSYAREDTHYLIYIYQKLCNELLKASNGNDNILKAVYQASTDVCKKRYFKPRLTETSHLDFYHKCKRSFDNRQMYALKEIFAWRDAKAREQDESTSYVLPNHMLLQISEMLPREVQGILACCNPIPPLVKANVVDLHQFILRAREQPLEKLIMKDDNRKNLSKEATRINIDSPLHCPHDLTKLQEFRDDLPTLLNGTLKLNVNRSTKLAKGKSSCSVFSSVDDESTNSSEKLGLKFLGPYERYKLIMPFIQEEERKAKERQEEEDDGPSIEERLAALHEHFIKVKEAVKQQEKQEEVESNEPTMFKEPLIEMGGRKKRKREQSPELTPHHPDYTEETENQLHTPVPKSEAEVSKQNWYDRVQGGKQHKNWKKNNKKKSDGEIPMNEEEYEKLIEDGNNERQFEQWENNRGGRGGKNRGRGWKNQQRGGRGGRGNNYRGRGSQNNSPGKRKNEEFNNTTPEKKHRPDFQSYDYSQVDYRQFQGGAGAVAHTNVKSNFRGKGKKRNFGNKTQNNRSMTFGGQRGNRGRGR